MIKSGTFTSVWDGGYKITTNCKVNTETKEVFDIEVAEVDERYEQLDCEYITLSGEEYVVRNVEHSTRRLEIADFWYE